ncbi:MAG: MIP/aquaporin family protein [Longimicrobiales bacterium]
MDRYITELVGTFFLVCTIGLSVNAGNAMAPIAIGLALTALVYMGGHVSGAHYNPAVTLGFLLAGGVDRRDVAPYVAAQVFGAWVAATTVQFISAESFAPAPSPGYSLAHVLLAESLFTFLLMLVILNVAMARTTRGNAFYGIAIGSTVTAGIFTVGDVSGAAFNPAVGLGPMMVDTMMGDGSLSNAWIYVVGPLAGAAAAVPVFRLQEAAGEPASE